jgi:hypothetical protein
MQRDEVPLEDIRNAARRASSYIEGMSRGAFLEDNKTKAATLYELVIMGEAATRISSDFRADHPEIPWQRAKFQSQRDPSGMSAKVTPAHAHRFDWNVRARHSPQPLLPQSLKKIGLDK